MSLQNEDKKSMRLRSHSVYMENRERVSITGVEDVESFNDAQVVLTTEQGILHVNGQDLHICKLNLDEGQLIVEGFIYLVEYEDEPQHVKNQGGGFFSRLLR